MICFGDENVVKKTTTKPFSSTFFFILTSLAVDVIFQVKIFGKRPIAELLKQNHPSLVCVDCVKLRLNILNLAPSPLSQQSNYLFAAELLLRNPRVALHVDLVEALVELKGGPEGLQEEPELPELQELIAELALARGGVLGEVEGVVDRLLAVEHLLEAEHVADAFVHLSQTQIPVAVHVHPVPNVPSLSVALFIVFKRQVCVDRLPVYFGSLHFSQALQTL